MSHGLRARCRCRSSPRKSPYSDIPLCDAPGRTSVLKLVTRRLAVATSQGISGVPSSFPKAPHSPGLTTVLATLAAGGSLTLPSRLRSSLRGRSAARQSLLEAMSLKNRQGRGRAVLTSIARRCSSLPSGPANPPAPYLAGGGLDHSSALHCFPHPTSRRARSPIVILGPRTRPWWPHEHGNI